MFQRPTDRKESLATTDRREPFVPFRAFIPPCLLMLPLSLASFTVILLIVLPLALCIHRLVLKRRNLHSLFVRADFNMPSMRAPFSPGSFGGKNGEYSVLPLFETSVAMSPKADHQA